MRLKAFLLVLCLPAFLCAQESELDKLVQRQAAFGRTIPQEKVFIHLDNTSYQLGDTIWFTAYTRRTDTDKPSDVSGVLYVELYGHEGYMIERKLIQLKEGRGSGFFALSKYIQYAGYYELRAYTRWQLNWGRFEHKHLIGTRKLFDSKLQEKEYYRDYEKLYSRVFPVYDRPVEPGDYSRDMTLRAMRRLYDFEAQKRELQLSLFPEGGNLVVGQPCRVAFEAASAEGEWPEGQVVCGDVSAKVQHRGRGVFEFIPQKGMEQEVVFTSKDGRTAKAKLPKAEQTGVSLRLEQEGNSWVARISHSADLPDDSLGVSLMYEGKFLFGSTLDKSEFRFDEEILQSAGVYQLTVFDTQGRVFADRLFFSRGKETLEPTLSIEGLKEEYQPYESVSLTLRAPEGKSNVSLTVRDDYNRDFIYDNGNILTEMLLASEIRGFVPQPGWYFEQDDEEHRVALDLLMMTQGWRRFDWRNMAVRGAWDITQPAEKAPILIGRTHKNLDEDIDYLDENGVLKSEKEEEDAIDDFLGVPQDKMTYETKPIDLSDFERGMRTNDSRRSREQSDYKKAVTDSEDEDTERKELKVHAEFVAVDAEVSFVGESETQRGAFRIQLPPFYGKSILFLSAADTTKWKEGKTYTWIQAEPDDEETGFMYQPASAKIRRKIFVERPDYLPRIVWPYPHFVQPYNYYQNHLVPATQQSNAKEWTRLDDETIISEVTIKAKRNFLRRFDDSWPILAIDAERAQNLSRDYGINFMQLIVGDYGVGAPNADDEKITSEPTFDLRYGYGRTRRMLMAMENDKEIPHDSLYARKYLKSISWGGEGGFEPSPSEKLEYEGNGVWDMWVLYSDYSPRMEGSNLYYGANEPKTKLVMYPFPDGSRYMTYRDRRYVLDGFAYPAEFYSPDYSNMEPPKEATDYRRTLYWNPNVKLDENGEAEIKFYNNCRTTQLSVEAEGQSSDGTLLWTK